MSEPTGRPGEPDTTELPAGAATTSIPASEAPTTEWAVASTGQPTQQLPAQPAAQPTWQPTGQPTGDLSGRSAEQVPSYATVPAGPAVTPDGDPRLEAAPGIWQSAPGGTLPPPQADPQPGRRPPSDVLRNGPERPARKLPLGLAAAGSAVLIAGAAFAAGLAIAGHDRVQNTAATGPLGIQPGAGQFGNRQQGNGNGQQGQGQGQGQQGQGGGQFGGPPNGGRLPSGIGALVAAGQIASTDGSTLVVQGQNGSVTVRTSDSTQVEQDLGGSVDQLQVGDLIFIAGTQEDDGSVTALAIADRPFFAGINPGGQGGQNTGVPSQDDGGVTT